MDARLQSTSAEAQAQALPVSTSARGSAADALAERIEALLPQTQCTRCGYGGCRPYADAIARGEAPINRCPPGGESVIAALATLLAQPARPLDPSCGSELDPGVAWIDPEACTGCARCLPVCPVDAIIGAQRLMHSVYAAECTGCELCIASCPVDCILMQPRPAVLPAPRASDNRRRYHQHLARLQRRSEAQARLLAERKLAAHRPPPLAEQ
jgi:Na+-translocating ferredoxin:NAD+ oxidoreductase subunit B